MKLNINDYDSCKPENNKGEPINPVITNGVMMTTGLTKREYMASMAMQGILSVHLDDDWDEEYASELAVAYADALLKELDY